MTHTDPLPPRPPRPATAAASTAARDGGHAPAIARQIDENIGRCYRGRVARDLPDPLRTLLARLRTQGGR